MRKTTIFLASLFILSSPHAFAADECWVVSTPKGYSAYADKNYNFKDDGLTNPILVCFGTDTGTVTGTDTQLVKFGIALFGKRLPEFQCRRVIAALGCS